MGGTAQAPTDLVAYLISFDPPARTLEDLEGSFSDFRAHGGTDETSSLVSVLDHRAQSEHRHGRYSDKSGLPNSHKGYPGLTSPCEPSDGCKSEAELKLMQRRRKMNQWHHYTQYSSPTLCSKNPRLCWLVCHNI